MISSDLFAIRDCLICRLEISEEWSFPGRSSRVGKKFLTDNESVAANFKQYEIDDRFMSLIIADASRHTMWRCGNNKSDGIFDAIVADRKFCQYFRD